MTNAKFFAYAAAGAFPIIVFLLLPMGTWADFASLPMHPLIVHGVIVALPVVAVWLLVSAWKPTLFDRSFPALWCLAVLAALGVIAAKSSGDSLAAGVGLPDAHAEAGTRLVPFTIALAAVVLVLGYVRLVRPIRPAQPVARGLAAVFAVAALPLTYAAGYSGAESVWKEDYAAAKAPISPGSISISLDEVRRHAGRDDCWAVVDGIVYDLTSFVARHPAGSSDIEEMCGTDATDDFLGEHDGQGDPESWLATLRIGVLAD